ncbi:MAG: penicillin-binding transpeptidase domain-containing protein [Christensenellales bacterium]
MKKFISIFILIALLFCLVSCGNNGDESFASGYLNRYSNRDFKACYSMLSSISLTEEEYVEKLTSIFDGLKVKEVTYDKLTVSEENGRNYCNYQMTYQTQNAGQLTFDYRMAFVKDRDGKQKISWAPNLIFPQMEEGDTVRVAGIKAARGEIFAADGTLLAANVSLPCFFAVPEKMKDVASAAASIAPLLDMDAAEIVSLIQSDTAQRDGYVVLKYYKSSDEITDEIREHLLAIPGIGFDSSNYVRRRQYPLGEAFAHTIGYVGTISTEEYATKKEKGYAVDEIVGKEGLELAYEEQLHGTDGTQIIILTENGNKRATLYKEEAKNGLDLRLSIDASLQQLAYDTMKSELLEGQSAVTIVMNPKTGFVEAIASYPSYDPNDFIGGISKEKWAQLSSEEANRPMFNRSLQGLYIPGSTLKPFTAAAALDSNTITLNTEFSLTIQNDVWIPDTGWQYAPIKRSSAPPHKLNLTECLIWSDNIFFAKTALEMGGEKLMGYFDKFGFGTTIPFDMKVAEPQYKDEFSELTPGLLADSAFGQGELQITPLQMAASFAAFVNAGDIMQPRIVQSIMQTNGKDYVTVEQFGETVWRDEVVSPYLCSKLLPIMENVIKQGTGHYLHATGVNRIAGKTGTAQVGKDREIGWFIAFWVGEEEPRLALTLVDGKPDELANKFDLARPLLSKAGQ